MGFNSAFKGLNVVPFIMLQRHKLLGRTCCPRLADRSNFLCVKTEIWISSKYWNHYTRTHVITSQEIVVLLLLSYFCYSHFIVSNERLNLNQPLFLYSVRVLLRSAQHCQATFNGPLGLHAWPGKFHRLTSPLSQTRCFECNPQATQFYCAPSRCTLLTTITTLIPFGLCFILLATAVMMFEVGTWRNAWSKTFGWRGKSQL